MLNLPPGGLTFTMIGSMIWLKTHGRNKTIYPPED